MNLDNHPTVIEIRRRNAGETTAHELPPLDADLLKKLCREAGADDVGLVDVDRPEFSRGTGQHRGSLRAPQNSGEFCLQDESRVPCDCLKPLDDAFPRNMPKAFAK